jgi:predicted membrane-bound spermidine synthase
MDYHSGQSFPDFSMTAAKVDGSRRVRKERKAAEASAGAADPDRDGNPALRRVLYLAFTLSGLTGLIYEATWTRYLQLFLGHAAYAQVLVLSLYMGGMAAGALLVSRVPRFRTAPLFAYAVIEGVLGVAAFVFHPLFAGVTTYAYDSLLPAVQGSGTALVLQWLLAAGLIIPQSILLGMTFPLMSAAVLRLDAGAGGRVFAMLYFTNSAGAVIGVLLAGFWLIEAFGLQATMMVAGAGNLVVAAVARWVAGRRVAVAPAVVRPARAAGIGRWLLAFAFLTAVASFLYEIAWLRMLALVQGASTHAFETMLSAFILGIALGGLWIRGRIERFGSPLAVLARVQILMGIAALATLPAYHLSFDLMQEAMARLPRTDLGYAGYNVVGYLISAGIMVPASFCAGMTLPLLTFVLYSRGHGESEIGAVYGWNTLGSIAGVALGSLVLLPLVGLKNVVVIGATVDIALGVALAAVLLHRREMPAARVTAALATAAIVAVLAGVFAFKLDATRMASGVFRHGKAHIADTSKVVFHADGRTATVDLVTFKDGTMTIATNGKADAGINMVRAMGNRDARVGADEFTMTFLGALPLAYAPYARRAAVIGHGSGLTTHVLLGSPAIEQVDVVEIEAEMIRGARLFGPRVARAYNDPRARYFVEDARAFFARAPQRYDIVVSEPSNPWVSGVASLFTPEFYRLAKRSLAPGGLFVQWFQLYEFDRPLTASIIRGVGEVFPDYVLYAANDTDMVLVASASGPVPPLSDALFGWPDLRAELGYLDIRTPAQLLVHRIASRRAYAPLLETGRPNSDYFPTLEFGAARARFLDGNEDELIRLARDPVPVLEMLSGFEPTGRAQFSVQGGFHYARFHDARRANLIADALAADGQDAATRLLPLTDQEIVERVRDAPANGSAQSWNEWFSALLTLSKPLLANGGAPTLERFVRTGGVAQAVRGAPPAIRDKVDFLFLVGRRDLERIRADGARLLETPIAQTDPAFNAYVLVATATACLALAPDASCARAYAQLDQVRREGLIFDLLRAHRAARG